MTTCGPCASRMACNWRWSEDRHLGEPQPHSSSRRHVVVQLSRSPQEAQPAGWLARRHALGVSGRPPGRPRHVFPGLLDRSVPHARDQRARPAEAGPETEWIPPCRPRVRGRPSSPVAPGATRAQCPGRQRLRVATGRTSPVAPYGIDPFPLGPARGASAPGGLPGSFPLSLCHQSGRDERRELSSP